MVCGWCILVEFTTSMISYSLDCLTVLVCLSQNTKPFTQQHLSLIRQLQLSSQAEFFFGRLHFIIQLNLQFHTGLGYWHLLLLSWNSVSFLWTLGVSAPDIRVESDAARNWGLCHPLVPVPMAPCVIPISIAIK